MNSDSQSENPIPAFDLEIPRDAETPEMRLAKKQRENISRPELKAFRKLADVMLSLDDRALKAAISNGTMMEVICDG